MWVPDLQSNNQVIRDSVQNEDQPYSPTIVRT
jgi:hypothetical protein